MLQLTTGNWDSAFCSASAGGGESGGVLGLIRELSEQDLEAMNSEEEENGEGEHDYTASTDSNLSSCSEEASSGTRDHIISLWHSLPFTLSVPVLSSYDYLFIIVYFPRIFVLLVVNLIEMAVGLFLGNIWVCFCLFFSFIFTNLPPKGLLFLFLELFR